MIDCILTYQLLFIPNLSQMQNKSSGSLETKMENVDVITSSMLDMQATLLLTRGQWRSPDRDHATL